MLRIFCSGNPVEALFNCHGSFIKNRRKAPAMLSEHHDILHEFPEYGSKLAALRTTNEQFDRLVTKHDTIDDEIRRLEETQLPISDMEFEKLKFERAALKDLIYQSLRTEAAKA